MPFEYGFLRSKVTRRVVWLFFLSALFPIILIALLSYTYVSDVLIQQTHSQLRHKSKLYGMSILEKLLFIDDKLRNTALIMRTGQQLHSDDIVRHFGTELNTLALVGEDRKIDMLFIDNQLPEGLSDYVSDDSATNKSIIFSETSPEGDMEVYMRLLLDSPQNGKNSLVAEISHEYLWGNIETPSFSTLLCVVEDTNKVLFCSHPTPDRLLEQLESNTTNSSSENMRWKYKDESYLAASWELFVKSRFNGPRWRIIASQREADALLSISMFSKLFPLVIFLSLLVILFLSITQIRRSMIPLEKLLAGTRRVANREFDKPVKVDSNDEFESLANSFNDMTARLGRQINTLTILSQIDQLILSNPNSETVLLSILKRIHEITPCELISISLVDKDEPECGWAYISVAGTKRIPKGKKINISNAESNMLLACNNTFKVDLNKDSWGFLDHLKKRGAKVLQIFPIIIDNKLNSIVSLSCPDGLSLNDEELGYIRDLVDRLSVALATASRDEKLYYQAHYDALTKLPNRQLLDDRLKQQIFHAHRENQLVGLLYIDLDRFKSINDSLGHSIGDRLLQRAAVRLSRCVREADTVARLGGDEFIVILSSLFSPKDASVLAENIITKVSKPFNIGPHEVIVTPSIGITIYPMDGSNSEELLKNADAAMYRAKEYGSGKYMFFEEKMNLEDMERTSMEHDMRHALQREEFDLFYQPQLNLQTGELVGVESLIRWNHPEHGVIPPSRFISLAEDTGMVEPIGEWVIREACNQYRDWHARGILIDRISVNVSCKQFIQSNFVDMVYRTLATSGMSPHRLELEITESLLMEDRIDTVYILDKLHAMGVKLSIDDFGTGYSSLSYLKLLPVDALKIDQSFIRDIPADEGAATITSSIIALAHELKLNVIAEGIETQQQLELLRSRHCDHGQGFYFAPPMSQDDFAEYVLQQNKLPDISPRAS